MLKKEKHISNKLFFTDCLYEKITAAKVTGKARAARMRRVWEYLSKKTYYLRTDNKRI